MIMRAIPSVTVMAKYSPKSTIYGLDFWWYSNFFLREYAWGVNVQFAMRRITAY
jgi:hypothetical protein